MTTDSRDADMTTLARLHAALDFVVEARTLLGEIRAGAVAPSPAIDRISASLAEAQQMLRNLLRRAPVADRDNRS